MSIDVKDRAKLSAGTSSSAIYRAVSSALASVEAGGTLLDVGCGRGELWPHLQSRFSRYIGADVVRYEEFPESVDFHIVDLDSGRVPLPDGSADVVVSTETIEHLENPRAFARELTRLARPDGRIVITTPNQLSLLSKLTLVLMNEFNAFRAGSYPAHLSALLEVDLRRIASECGWVDVTVGFTGNGRIPGTSRHWPSWLSGLSPRSLSDNVIITGRKPKTT